MGLNQKIYKKYSTRYTITSRKIELAATSMKAIVKINSLLVAIAVIYIFILGAINLIKDMGIHLSNSTSLPKQALVLIFSTIISIVIFGRHVFSRQKA